MKTKEIKQAILLGKNFSNENLNFFTLCKSSENRYILVLNDDYFFYKNVDLISKRIFKLMNTGA